MKKAILFTFLAIITIASFNSCKKDPVTAPVVNDLLGIPKIKTTSYSYPGNTPNLETLQYDANGRIIHDENKENGILARSTSVVYLNSTTITLVSVDYQNSPATTDTSTITLNDKGQAIHEEYSPTDNWDITYDSNGFMEDGEVLVVANGNVVKRGTVTYEFNLDKTNTIGYKNMGIGFYGNDDKNLVTKWTDGADIHTFTYEFDSKGRVTKQTELNPADATYYEIYSYTYTD